MWIYICLAVAFLGCLFAIKTIYDTLKQGANGGKWVKQNASESRFVEVRYKFYMGTVRAVSLIHDQSGWALARVAYDTFKCVELETTTVFFPDEASARAAFAVATSL